MEKEGEMNTLQVQADHYDFLNYVSEKRFCSYYKQIEEIMKCNAKTVLLIGVGDGIVQSIITMLLPEIRVTTVDFDASLQPDICCDVRELQSVIKEKYDAVICCQVLEHLPYENFEYILAQIRNILKVNGRLILSLPDRGLELRINIHIPGLKGFSVYKRFCRFYKKNFLFNGEHYWEINVSKLYHIKRVRNSIKKYFQIDREYLVANNTFHRFFVLSV